MTLPVSGSISLSDVLTELKVANPSRTVPIVLGDAEVLALAGKSAPPISISDLYGKSSYIAMTITSYGDSNSASSGTTSSTVTCSPSVTVTNGAPTKSYAWSFTSNPDGCTLGNSTLSACTVSHGYGKSSSGTAHAVLQVIVNDGVNAITTGGITADLDWVP